MERARYCLQLSVSLKDAIWEHMLTHPHGGERLGFLFTRQLATPTLQTLNPLEWVALHDGDLVPGSGDALEMTSEAQARIIKRAHDLDAILVEFHSHPWDVPAAFSWTDMEGFDEFVPYVRWRLKDRPYGAVVVSKRNFDTLFWDGDIANPTVIDPLLVESSMLRPTGHTRRYPREAAWN